MSQGNVTLAEGGIFSEVPTKKYQTEAAATDIKFGEPVILKGAGSQYVIPAADADPIIGTTTKVCGIAAVDSNHTLTADGVMEVFIPLEGQVYMCAPLDPTAIDTQAKYDALVNQPVAFNLAAGVYTIETTSAGATDGLVIAPLNIAKHPNMVAFEIRNSGTNLA